MLFNFNISSRIYTGVSPLIPMIYYRMVVEILGFAARLSPTLVGLARHSNAKTVSLRRVWLFNNKKELSYMSTYNASSYLLL